MDDDTPFRSNAESTRRIAAALGRLPARRREIFLLHRDAGLSYRQIAARYGISVARVERHIARAMLHLADELGDTPRPRWRRWP